MEQGVLSGTVIDNQIEILEAIGEGGMGAVFKAFHRGWNQPMAVKVPHLHLLAEPAERERFLLEAIPGSPWASILTSSPAGLSTPGNGWCPSSSWIC